MMCWRGPGRGPVSSQDSIQQDGEKGMVQTRACVFQDAVDLERVKAWDQVFIKLMRRYKYLEYVVRGDEEDLGVPERIHSSKFVVMVVAVCI